MDVRLDNPWKNAFAGEIDFLRPRDGRFQDFSVGPNGRESIAVWSKYSADALEGTRDSRQRHRAAEPPGNRRTWEE
jgi:hypothetical protein